MKYLMRLQISSKKVNDIVGNTRVDDNVYNGASKHTFELNLIIEVH